MGDETMRFRHPAHGGEVRVLLPLPLGLATELLGALADRDFEVVADEEPSCGSGEVVS